MTCKGDGNCAAIYDKECNGKAIIKLCPLKYPEKVSTSGSCLYKKSGIAIETKEHKERKSSNPNVTVEAKNENENMIED